MSDMQIQSVLQQMRALAQTSKLEGIESTGPIQSPEGQQRPGELNFAETLTDSLRAVNGLQQESKDLQTRFELGDANVSLPQVMVAMSKSSLAFEATNQVRNRLLTAYQEVMRMSV
ncbi:flagellar hook-basal body complex protein FliE [Thiorhodovibrio frisius]|uniref:Flagellar hook-basal body complex protein FliE n=1 Tax=Thiorhodovibrio frisius TaxID=631362 RepID=H8YZ34_9GAMM|nr:flagellar hook-basal body complex protein FliE [Thiorhodovibrio frisius]EIC21961.1 flagellar hook-basal body complex protein FliE [Thiorhodovibrio frisius]WPL24250.1 Flagellar hook-basal body complex protein FliE [Thiorhodovibrio frisius]